MPENVIDPYDALEGLSGDERTVREAHLRFNEAVVWEAVARSNGDADERFIEGDAYNLYQWPDRLANDRVITDKPTLTNSRARVHCLQIINDMRQNKPGIVIRPTGGGATYQAAQTFQAMIEHIEYRSNAEAHYDKVGAQIVKRGIGYLRAKTRYVDNMSFDQEIIIDGVNDPRCVYLDTNVKDIDGLDARWGFVFEDMSRNVFKEEYPKFAHIAGLSSPLGNSQMWGTWITPYKVRVAEYYRKKTKRDVLYLIVDADGNETVVQRSKVDPDVLRAALGAMEARGQMIRSRDILDDTVEWFKVAGEEIIERTIWPGKYIPIVKLVGEQTVIDGVLDWKGHVRPQLDPQRMLNYAISNAVEGIVLQTKSPWLAPTRATEGLEQFWNAANVENVAVLPWQDIDENGIAIQSPQRIAPPQPSQAYLAMMTFSEQQIQMVTGQYEANFGEPGNERSGRAIERRQRQGDNASYHYIDGLGYGLKGLGKVLVDLIPKVYDTERVIRIKARDGTERDIRIDPNAQEAMQTEPPTKGEPAIVIFNPSVGMYDVQADTGPGYSTLRQEAFNALMQLVGSNQNLMQIFGDLLFRSADFPLADEMAERMRRVIPAHILGEGPSPEVAEFQAKLEQMGQLLQQLITEGAERDLDMKRIKDDRTADFIRLALDSRRIDIGEEDALTKRLTALDNMQNVALREVPNELRDAIKQAIDEAIQEFGGKNAGDSAVSMPPAGGVDAISGAGGGGMPGQGAGTSGGPPTPGAQQAPDGKWYVPDPQRQGKYLQVRESANG